MKDWPQRLADWAESCSAGMVEGKQSSIMGPTNACRRFRGTVSRLEASKTKEVRRTFGMEETNGKRKSEAKRGMRRPGERNKLFEGKK
jgi:hypothetical protein